MVHKKTKIIEWSVPEYIQKEKSNDWYWGVGMIGIAGVVLSAVFGNFLLAVLIFIAGLLLFTFSGKAPEIITVEISEQGILIRNKLFPHYNIKSFWIIDRSEHGFSKLVLHIDRFMDPIVSLPIHPEIALEDLREILLTFTTEEETQEPITDRISDIIGF
ncbi:MAG: hypothetical protein KBC22_00340 [Candidatus Pacebacteria bacterium]|nr:hypothetical protein [Candidatus Paceibacterota bacterium]